VKFGKRAIGLGKLAVKSADTVATVAKVAVKSADQLGWVARTLPTLNKAASVVVHGGLSKVSKRAHDVVSDALTKIGFNVCFTGRTPLLLEDGTAILAKNLRPGVKLLSRDEFDAEGAVSGKVTAKKVRVRLAPRLIAARSRFGFKPLSDAMIVSTP